MLQGGPSVSFMYKGNNLGVAPNFAISEEVSGSLVFMLIVKDGELKLETDVGSPTARGIPSHSLVVA